VDFLRKRYAELRSTTFLGNAIREPSGAERLMPLDAGPDGAENVAATRALLGTDVNFGSLTRSMVEWLQKQDGVSVVPTISERTQLLDERWMSRQDKADGSKQRRTRDLSQVRAEAPCRFAEGRHSEAKGLAAFQ
jgi:malate dehydrogenase (quinone)